MARDGVEVVTLTKAVAKVAVVAALLFRKKISYALPTVGGVLKTAPGRMVTEVVRTFTLPPMWNLVALGALVNVNVPPVMRMGL
jgi:hypothetical protein